MTFTAQSRGIQSVVALLVSMALAACGGSSTTDGLEISPASTDLAPGEGAQFNASAVGPIAWSVAEPGGGTIDEAGAYVAPSDEGTYHVVAEEAALARSTQAEVRVKRGVRISVSPTSATLAPGASQQFTATVGGTSARGVTWSVVEGGSGGTVSGTGLYTAPSGAGTFHVVATSNADASKSASATVTVASTSAPSPPPAGTSSQGTGTGYAPSYVSVTGGGAMPSTSGAVVASCAGNGSTDDTSCLQSAANAAHSQAKPLVIPATSSFYRITAPITVYGSVIGTGGMPTIKQTSACSSASCAGLRLAAGMTGWIYNLHLVGAGSASARGEYAHNINVGGVNGVTIKGNLLENPMGDGIADNAQENDGASAARNVLVDGNTFVNWGRCMVSLVNVSDRWAIMNNLASDDVAYVSPIDLEPWHEASSITNVEVGYNKITTPANAAETSAGNYVGVVTVSGWFDSTPGANVYAHHNYGSWPFSSFVKSASNAGSFSNVVNVSNVQGSSPP